MLSPFSINLVFAIFVSMQVIAVSALDSLELISVARGAGVTPIGAPCAKQVAMHGDVRCQKFGYEG